MGERCEDVTTDSLKNWFALENHNSNQSSEDVPDIIFVGFQVNF